MQNQRPKNGFSEAQWQAYESRRRRPAKERFADLVEAGIIDANGNVLVRAPEIDEQSQ